VAAVSTMTQTSATLPYIHRLASGDYRQLLYSDPHFAAGLNVFDGRLTHPAVAEALDAPWTTPDAALSQPMHLKSA